MKTQESTSLILIADTHLLPEANSPEFFSTLARLHALPRECGVVFLGDVFDMWIALPGYETDAHRTFLAWCREERKRRTIVFLEGNHEFFVSLTHADAFTFAGDGEWRLGDFLATHGDLINRRDWKYRLLRFGVRNLFARTLLRLGGRLGIGPRIVRGIREGLRKTNLRHKKDFPADLAKRWLLSLPPGSFVAVGHFHRAERIQADGRTLEAIPACEPDGTGIMTWRPDAPVCRQWNEL